jgi:hypothetical protein
MDTDIDFLINVLFDSYENCVGFHKPKPLESNMETLVEHHQCSSICPDIFIPIQILHSEMQALQNAKYASFQQIVKEVLKSCSIDTYQSSFYIGPNQKEWNLFMPIANSCLDILWMDEISEVVMNAKIYVFRSNYLEKYVSQFENVYLVSPDSGSQTYIVASNHRPNTTIKMCLHNLCSRFRWKQNQQQSQYKNLQKWGQENNQQNVQWENITYVPVSPKYQRKYISVSDDAKGLSFISNVARIDDNIHVIPVSPKYTRSKTLAELWLDKNITH